MKSEVKQMKVGMLVAVEMDAVFKKYGDTLVRIEKPGYEVYHYRMGNADIYALASGAGEIAAAAGTQLLISEFHVDVIVNFGVVGGLTPEMGVTRTCVVEKVVHYDFDTSPIDHCEEYRYLLAKKHCCTLTNQSESKRQALSQASLQIRLLRVLSSCPFPS